ncbi:uncharacterized protein [Cherax quadricarinatus]
MIVVDKRWMYGSFQQLLLLLLLLLLGGEFASPSDSSSPSSTSSPVSPSPVSPSSTSSPVSRCGCWGSNQVYLQYKAPATGWYSASPFDKYLYNRSLDISGKVVHYLLEYRSGPKYWLLMEKRTDGETVVVSNKREKKILVSCPTRCSCRKILVERTVCWATEGVYIRSDITENTDKSFPMWQQTMTEDLLENNNTQNNDTELSTPELSTPRNETKKLSIIEQSTCLLHELVKCIESEGEINDELNNTQEESTKIEEGCEPLITKDRQNGTCVFGHDGRCLPQEYVMRGQERYVLTQADEGFWWIVDDNEVYAVSEDAGLCPDQLFPESKWISVNDMQTDSNINVTCIERDSPEGETS